MDTEQLSAKFQRFKENFVANNKVYSGISEPELIAKLEKFKNKCHEKGYIEGDLFLNEAYPGMKPTSFIVNLFAKKQWLKQISRGKALDALIETLRETTTPNIRENIFTLRMLTWEDLTASEIIEMFLHPNNSVRVKLISFIKTGVLTEQQILSIFDTENWEIIKLLTENKKAEEVAFNSKELKFKWSQWTI
ncbi:hypothetical protein BCS42_06835 [Crenothrix sp. D3]|nr:hypothetical protein BCS42_06835 [Crenothrix sp. D3]